MRYVKGNYNRLMADRMFEWNETEWIIDRNGQFKLKDDMNNTEIDTITISPLFSIEEQ